MNAPEPASARKTPHWGRTNVGVRKAIDEGLGGGHRRLASTQLAFQRSHGSYYFRELLLFGFEQLALQDSSLSSLCSLKFL
jgi:hypothetical protein